MVLQDHVTNGNHYVSTTRAPVVSGHQIWQDDNLPWWTPTHNIKRPFDHVIVEDYVINYNQYFSITTVPIATKLGRVVTYLDGLLLIKLHDSLIMWSCEIKWQTKIIFIFTTTLLMATKSGRVVTYFEGLLTIKSFNALITWSCKVTC